MRFMIVVRATRDTEAGKMPEEKLFAAMAAHHEELARAGVLLDASGLRPTSKGLAYQVLRKNTYRCRWALHRGEGAHRQLHDVQVKSRSREEAREWTKRFPNPMGEGAQAEIEVRQLY